MQVKIFHDDECADMERLINRFLERPEIIVKFIKQSEGVRREGNLLNGYTTISIFYTIEKEDKCSF